METHAIALAVQTLFAELLQQVETAPLAGSVYRRTLQGGEYIYAKIPVGSIRMDQFIGKSGYPEAEARAKSLQLGAELATQPTSPTPPPTFSAKPGATPATKPPGGRQGPHFKRASQP